VHPTILYDPLLFRAEGAEQAGRVCGGGQRRHPGVLGTRRPSENMTFRFMFHEDKHAKHALPLKRSADNDIMSNNDINTDKNNDNIKDGIEDANQNGRIDGDNGDGKWGESETWTELNPNDIDTDGDTFNDNNEKEWGYNPLSTDTDGDGLNDNEEDLSNYGIWDSSTETSVTNSDTDRDGLSDKMEQDGWKVIIIYEATLEIKTERNVESNPLIADYDGDGINDCGEFENGTDPNDDDTDDDGLNDKEEIDYDYGSSPIGIDGTPPEITDFKATYDLEVKSEGLKLVSKYKVKIKVSASDIFGVDWIEVHMRNVDHLKNYVGDDQKVHDVEFEFSLSIDQAVISLFKSFSLNITAQDNNENIGYKEEEVPSILEMISSVIIGVLTIVVKVIMNAVNIIKGKIIDLIKVSLEKIQFPDFTSITQNSNISGNFLFKIGNKIYKSIIIIACYLSKIIEPAEKFIYDIKDIFYNIVVDVFMAILTPMLGNVYINKEIFNYDTFFDRIESIDFSSLSISNVFENTLSSLLPLTTFNGIVDFIGKGIIKLFSSILNNVNSILFNSQYNSDYESGKGFTESSNFDLIWESMAIISIIADLITIGMLIGLIIIDTLVLLEVIDPFELFEGVIWILLALLLVIEIIVFAIDVCCFLYHWGDELGSIGEDIHDVHNDVQEERFYIRTPINYVFAVLLPCWAAIFGWIAGLPWKIIPGLNLMGEVMLIFVDIPNIVLGLLYILGDLGVFG